MSLQERLAAAQEERRRAAGLPPLRREPTPATPPAPVERPAVEAATVARSVLDLTTEAPVIDLRTPAPSFSSVLDIAESSASCPACGGEPRLDMTDVVGGVDHYTCLECAHLFQVARGR